MSAPRVVVEIRDGAVVNVVADAPCVVAVVNHDDITDYDTAEDREEWLSGVLAFSELRAVGPVAVDYALERAYQTAGKELPDHE